MKTKISSNFSLFSAIVFILFLTSFIARPMFETTDDLTIISMLIGYFGQPAYPDGIFISKVLSQVLFFCMILRIYLGTVASYFLYKQFLYFSYQKLF